MEVAESCVSDLEEWAGPRSEPWHKWRWGGYVPGEMRPGRGRLFFAAGARNHKLDL